MAAIVPTIPSPKLAEKVAAGDPSGLEFLYRLINDSVRPYLRFRLQNLEVDDVVHETLTIAAEQIRAGELRNPKAIGPYIHRIARRQANISILRRMWRRKTHVNSEVAKGKVQAAEDPESVMIGQERTDVLLDGLKRLPERERELLTRFYLDGESLEQIAEAMGLTSTQVRLTKHRAKAKLIAWAQGGVVVEQD